MPANIKLPNLPIALEKGLRFEEDLRDNFVLHVSDLSATIPGEGCPRQLWLRIHGAGKKKLSAGQMLMFHHGKRIHEDLIPLLEIGLQDTEWEIYRVEQPLNAKDIVGTTDIIFRNKKDGTFIVGDFKSMRGNGFRYLDPDNAKPAHVLQVQAYIYLCAIHAVCDPVMGLVFYVDREGQNAFQQRAVVRDDAAVKEAIKDAKDIISNEEPPDILEPYLEITVNKGDNSVKLLQPWSCDYCDYADISCAAALDREHRGLGIIGYCNDFYDFNPTKKVKGKTVRLCDRKVETLTNNLIRRGNYVLKTKNNENEDLPF